MSLSPINGPQEFYRSFGAIKIGCLAALRNQYSLNFRWLLCCSLPALNLLDLQINKPSQKKNEDQ